MGEPHRRNETFNRAKDLSMAKSETTTEPKPIPLIITGLSDLGEMDGIGDERVYAVGGADLNRLIGEAAVRIKYQLDAAGRAAKAERERDETRAQFADLKERLHEAEVSKARLEGYLDRVAQDDHANDGFAEIADGAGDVTARPLRSSQGYRAGFMGGQSGVLSGSLAGSADYGDPNRPSKRRVHWTSY